MKKTILLSFLIILGIILIDQQVVSQVNPFTGAFESNSNTAVVNSKSTTSENSKSPMGIACDANSFFAISYSTGQIDKFILTGNTVSAATTVETGAGKSIAYCNNLNGGAYSPTFYSESSSTFYPTYFDGSSWTSTPVTSLNINGGGYGNYLYFQSHLPGYIFNRYINKYDGTNLTTIYNTHDKYFCVMDLAVDNTGNVYCVISADSTTLLSDSIKVISPTGHLIKQFPFTYNCVNAYGAFILGNTFYIGFGNSNTTSPNSILPITFTASTAVIGSPISMPVSDYSDLESCNQGYPLSINEQEELPQFNIYPNPALNNITIETPQQSTIEVSNIQGQLIKTLAACGNKTNIDVSTLPDGVYVVKVKTDKGITTKKFIK